MDRQYSELNMWGKSYSGVENEPDEKLGGQEGYKATRLEKYTETRHILERIQKVLLWLKK